MSNNPIFENDKYDIIAEFIEEKIPVLKENKDFCEKYNKIYSIMDILKKSLKKEERLLLDDLIDLNYEVEKYYFVLAYSLGVKYGEELNKI